jgi:hypothetical protein
MLKLKAVYEKEGKQECLKDLDELIGNTDRIEQVLSEKIQ